MTPRARASNAAFPRCCRPLPKAWPNNRLGLARWLVSTENPLTARVTVNRFWQMFFSTGLVKTVGGLRRAGRAAFASGVARLAGSEFQQSGWNVKALLKTIVMSAPIVRVQDSLRNCCSAIPKTGCWRAARGCDCPPR